MERGILKWIFLFVVKGWDCYFGMKLCISIMFWCDKSYVVLCESCKMCCELMYIRWFCMDVVKDMICEM